MKKLAVICHAGHRAEEYPKSFLWKGHLLEVKNTEKRWMEPRFRLFEVFASDGCFYLLRYEEQKDEWEAERLPRQVFG